MSAYVLKKATSLLVYSLGFLVLGFSPTYAGISYDVAENTITLESGTNTLASIRSELVALGYPDVLAYDATLVFKNYNTHQYHIKPYRNLVIENMTVKAANPSYCWIIWVHAEPGAKYDVSITDSDFSGGVIRFKPTGAQEDRGTIVLYLAIT
ncbi:MAG: hypothetical protein KKG09_02630 [Verrucomicrobia bacterium]|nr:hypothetical protein [Verrucomicrobiota bacterium]MCG2681801.1 hypothetical protein [Kiritimatiellia bacterium]MBU4247282.1 hypothetical protein [Verrucomicrobiota bacterium]MBU4289898.1 hypothetical protein [Verrucomicrobiota bacterium]MBU4427958.1 hypothetical protein [Verrucomicrobiota bacterium]